MIWDLYKLNTVTYHCWKVGERSVVWQSFSLWDLFYILHGHCFRVKRLQDSSWGCHVHMAQNVIGCSRSQITSEVQFGVYQKTQCSSNTNWTAVERRRLKLTMQLLGDLERERVNSTTQLIFKAHLKMIFCCSFATGRIAPVAIFCPAALNSVLQPPIS